MSQPKQQGGYIGLSRRDFPKPRTVHPVHPEPSPVHVPPFKIPYARTETLSLADVEARFTARLEALEARISVLEDLAE